MKIEPRKDKSGHIAIGPALSTQGREVILVNPEERQWTRERFVFAFGAYGWTRLMVWADGLDSALETAIDWIAEYAPGLLHDDEVNEEYQRLIDEGMPEEQAFEESSVDCITFGHNGLHFLPSWEWAIALENPTRQELIDYINPK